MKNINMMLENLTFTMLNILVEALLVLYSISTFYVSISNPSWMLDIKVPQKSSVLQNIETQDSPGNIIYVGLCYNHKFSFF